MANERETPCAGEDALLGALGFLLGAGLVAVAVAQARRPAARPAVELAPAPAEPARAISPRREEPAVAVPPAALAEVEPLAAAPAPRAKPRARRGLALVQGLLFGSLFGAPWLLSGSVAAASAASAWLHTAAVAATPALHARPEAAPVFALARPVNLTPVVEPPPTLPGLFLPALPLPPELAMSVLGGENPAMPMDVSAGAGTEFSVVAAGDAGGALPDLGVFQDGSVLTLYLDHPPGGWTLECARLFPLGADEPAAGPPLAPPQVAWAEAPAWPPADLAAYGGATLAITGVLDRQGRLSGLQVLRSPDSRLAAPALSALARWMFRPASVNRTPVAVRVLLGVPLPLP